MEDWELCTDQKNFSNFSRECLINVFSVAIDQLNVSLLNKMINIFKKKKILTDPTSQYCILCITITFINVLQKCPNTFEAIKYSYCLQRTTLVYWYHKLTGNITP